VSLSHSFVVVFFRSLTSLICRVHDQELQRIPQQGPLIIYTNHVNVLEIPIIYTHLQPRKVHGMLLAERWKIPVMNWVFDVTETVPLHRGEADLPAIRTGLEVLKRGEMLIIAPEGTRSHDGQLQGAHPGVVLLALHSGATLIPVGYYGGENYTANLRKLKRTDFHLGVGKPFTLDIQGKKATKELRQQIMDEMMYQLAMVLPEKYRGAYADFSKARMEYLKFF
jgi:1-acyl-sn-glycerol-3-phosphate acyltransferase